MPKTLLAVDDSVTMRKALEITFSGDDFRVLTADGPAAALAKAGEADVILVDTVLGGDDGYALASQLRRARPGVAIVLLTSRYNPHDQGKAREAGADDFADKPFDTQQLLDKVRKVMVAKESAGPVAAAAPPAPAPAHAPPPVAAAPAPMPPRPAAPAPAPVAAAPASAGLPRGTQPSLGGAAQQALGGASPGPLPPRAAPAPVAASPAPAPVAPAPPPAPAPVAHAHAPAPAVAAAVNGHMAQKLGDMGLTPAQADAVLALSREVVERVVWEVVPQLAETMIKEEIARLTRE